MRSTPRRPSLVDHWSRPAHGGDHCRHERIGRGGHHRQWLERNQTARPGFPGDTLYANTEVLDKRESRSRPNAGIVSVLTRGINQEDTEVCVFERQILIPKRNPA